MIDSDLLCSVNLINAETEEICFLMQWLNDLYIWIWMKLSMPGNAGPIQHQGQHSVTVPVLDQIVSIGPMFHLTVY